MGSSNILAVASYGRNAGSARVRLFEWLDYLNVVAHEENYLNKSTNSLRNVSGDIPATVCAERRLRRIAKQGNFDTAIISRRASPFSNGKLESRILASASLGVYDFDDLIGATPRVGMQRLWSQSRTWERAIRAADRVIAGNSFLAEQASSMNNNVSVIPSCVNTDLYRKKDSYAIDYPTAVWIGSPSTEYYLTLIAEPLLRLHEAIGLKIMVISSGNQSLGELDSVVKRVEWTNANFFHLLSTADIGLMPLTDSQWARGKCAYKLLQYGAAGLPMIGTPVGANREVLETSSNLSAVGPQDWFEKLEHFFKQSDRYRSALGRRANVTVETKYSFRAWSEEWKNLVGLG